MTDILSQYALVWTLAGTAGAAALAWTVARWAVSPPAQADGAPMRVDGRPPGAPSVVAYALPSRVRVLLVAGVALGSLAFTLLGHALARPGPLEAFDRGLATGIAQSSNPIVLKGAALFTTVGDHNFLMGVVCAVLVMLLWRKQWMLASAWVAASAGGGLLNAMLKALFERARPDHVHGFVHASGFSFPSGHASGAVAVYAMLVFVLLRFIPPARQPALLAAAVALVAAIGFSRVLLHVHYFSDVLAGWAITGAWVALCVLALERVERRYVVTTSG